jgi:hypothetical protein
MNALAAKRPIGIYLLSHLYFLYGLVGFAWLSLLLAGWDRHMVRHAGNLFVMLASIAILFAASNGMWKGARWGWYLGSFLGTYGMLRNILAIRNGLVLFQSMAAEELAALSHGPAYYYVKWSLGILIGLLTFLYFFKANVQEYFAVTGKRLQVAAVAELLLAIAMVLTMKTPMQ